MGHPDRWCLHRALGVLVSESVTSARISVALHALFQDLELYDDPMQGVDDWKTRDELPMLDDLMTRLHQFIGSKVPGASGANILENPNWPEARLVALAILERITANGLERPWSARG